MKDRLRYIWRRISRKPASEPTVAVAPDVRYAVYIEYGETDFRGIADHVAEELADAILHGDNYVRYRGRRADGRGGV